MIVGKSHITFLILIFSLGVYGQEKIDYQDKRILKSLQKYDIPGPEMLQEMFVAADGEKGAPSAGKFFRLKEDAGISHVQYIFIGRVNSCRAGGCSVQSRPDTDMNSEYFDYFMFLDSSGTIEHLEVFNYQATHGYEVTARGWLKQFRGYDGTGELKVNKNIDAIAGATISVHSLTADIRTRVQRLKDFMNQQH